MCCVCARTVNMYVVCLYVCKTRFVWVAFTCYEDSADDMRTRVDYVLYVVRLHPI